VASIGGDAKKEVRGTIKKEECGKISIPVYTRTNLCGGRLRRRKVGSRVFANIGTITGSEET